MIYSIVLWCIIPASGEEFYRGGREIFLNKDVGPIGKNVSGFRSELILAEVNFEGSRPTRCRLSSIRQPGDDDRIKELLSDVSIVEDDKMLQWVTICGKLETKLRGETAYDDMWYIMQEIYPGTLWCGPGNVAESYAQLGRYTETDRCCRNHDYCPVCIPPHTDKYGFNMTFAYSVLSCECDRQFHQCLNKAAIRHRSARFVKEIYFRLYNGHCVGYSNGRRRPFRMSEALHDYLFNR
ncbi:uncharacterized protein LOC100900196 [Galendromus occidentalis]|uniref:Uncharacterized protein LOC100900196 n=1 Tax=Galendromus occidentalis TaxID=34638 RepID=A0AAJ6VX07_9ACAR|nr:uncharacterized protein LOC100900196 [Galendromus occidentalis]